MYITGKQVNGGGWDQIEKLHLYRNDILVKSILVKSITPTITDGVNRTILFDIANDPIFVPKDGAVALFFKADTPELNYELNGMGPGLAASFEGIQLAINANTDVTAKGAQSGTTLVDADKSVVGAAGNRMYLVRGVPIFRLNETGGTIPSGTTTQVLHSFAVSADSAVDVGLGKVSYQISGDGVTVENYKLYTGSTWVGFLARGSDISPAGFGKLNIGFDSRSDAIISAGTTKTFSLKGDLICSSATGCSSPTGGGLLVVRFLGDLAPAASAPLSYMDVYNSAEGDIVWTDFWRTPTLEFSSSTSTTTEQWLNSYLIKDISGGNLGSTSSGAVWAK